MALSDHITFSFGVNNIWQNFFKDSLRLVKLFSLNCLGGKVTSAVSILFVFVEVTLFISSQFSSQLSVYRLLVEYITRKTTTGVGVLYWNDKNPVACFR